jgi:uncharacterized protein (DUF58 family)
VLRNLYLTPLLYTCLAAGVCLFVLAFFFPALLPVVQVLVGALGLLLVMDVLAVFRLRKGMLARRSMAEKLSNGSENEIFLHLENRYPFAVTAEVLDELPVQFQQRDTVFEVPVPKGQTSLIRYLLRPVERGEYRFGAINVYVRGPLRLVRRRYRFAQDQTVPVYPSFLQMRQYELLAISNRLTEVGVKKVRKVGHSAEFEQVKAYVPGDDPRTINWKATARRSELMVNGYQDEKSQQVYSLLDKGRLMQMPFEGLSLLDYAINASLVVSNIVLHKQDKAGLVTFAETIGQVLPADRRASHLQRLLEVLYNQQTNFLESDYELLYATVKTKVKQRSLLLLFTNFETLAAVRRQLPYLRRLAKDHLLLVIFFENTELRHLLDQPATSTEEIYHQTIAGKFAYEKRQIVKELAVYGIQPLLTAPQHLTVNTINKYLEFKARGVM